MIGKIISYKSGIHGRCGQIIDRVESLRDDVARGRDRFIAVTYYLVRVEDSEGVIGEDSEIEMVLPQDVEKVSF